MDAIDVVVTKRGRTWDGRWPEHFSEIVDADKLPDGRWRVQITPDDGAAVVLNGLTQFHEANSSTEMRIDVPRQTTGEYDWELRLRRREPKAAPIPWPWPEIEKFKIGPVKGSPQWREIFVLCGGLWVPLSEGFARNIFIDSFGDWHKDESRISTRGPDGNVVLTKAE